MFMEYPQLIILNTDNANIYMKNSSPNIAFNLNSFLNFKNYFFY